MASLTTYRALVHAVKARGGTFEPTGGGCEAWRLPIPGTTEHALLTAAAAPETPQTLDDPCALGRYDANGDLLGEVQRFATVHDALAALPTLGTLGPSAPAR